MITPRAIVRAGVAPPEEEPEIPLAEAIETAVTVPCGVAISPLPNNEVELTVLIFVAETKVACFPANWS